jgi:hypothetical protein
MGMDYMRPDGSYHVLTEGEVRKPTLAHCNPPAPKEHDAALLQVEQSEEQLGSAKDDESALTVRDPVV